MIFTEMGFINSYIWTWASCGLFQKACLLIVPLLIVCGFLITLKKGGKSIFVNFFYISIIFIPPLVVGTPTTKQLVEKYENGDISTSVFERLAPYAVMKDKENKKKREDELRERENEEAIERARVRAQIEQREYRKEEAERILNKIERGA